jgi:hypothetical protein
MIYRVVPLGLREHRYKSKQHFTGLPRGATRGLQHRTIFNLDPKRLGQLRLKIGR